MHLYNEISDILNGGPFHLLTSGCSVTWVGAFDCNLTGYPSTSVGVTEALMDLLHIEWRLVSSDRLHYYGVPAVQKFMFVVLSPCQAKNQSSLTRMLSEVIEW